MRLKTLLAAGALAAGFMAAAPVGASANIVWCAGDPPSQVVSAGGTRFVVNTLVYVSGPKLHLASQYTVETEAAPEAGGTVVVVTVRAPEGPLLLVVSSVQRSTARVTAQASGHGVITVVLHVPID